MTRTLTFRTRFLILLTAFAFVAGQSISQSCPDSIYTGQATFYTVNGPGNCSLPVSASPIYTASINAAQYNTAATCGACIQVTSSHGSAILSVEDQCVGCATHSLDISIAADSIISDSSTTPVAISWHYIGCPVTGGVQVYFNNTTRYYAELQIRNHRYPIQKVEYQLNSVYATMTRRSDNYFTSSTGVGIDSAYLRITDILGDVIEERVIIANNSFIASSQQFPACVSTGISDVAQSSPLIISGNPSADGHFAIENNSSGHLPYAITDLSGRAVSSGYFAKGINEAHISAPGVYILYSTSPQGAKTTKLLVQ